ncbi:Putative protein [Zobellia galactanivorans]|uniref:Uncharacterized protein n=1 Tax=Zobellia galactanivorans (strain DSM 12802 / CCUG 47099 / CIP 106680 / NCIMB 13871 / Dsij) TaxID=63186 RepID=G0L0H3_ZOBGA|nr:Putative protein [Zobellia galactanivorans]
MVSEHMNVYFPFEVFMILGRFINTFMEVTLPTNSPRLGLLMGRVGVSVLF